MARNKIITADEKLKKVNAITKKNIVDVANKIFKSKSKSSFADIGKLKSFNKSLITTS